MTARLFGGDLWIRGGHVVGVDEVVREDVLILRGRVQQVGRAVLAPAGCPVLDATGRLVFPGFIDSHVHFREPGLEHKEDLASGSLAAVAGGITSFCEMPNTSPHTDSPERLADKVLRARARSHADFAFFLRATRENADRLGDWENLPGCAGIKVLRGVSGGSLLIPDEASLERVLRSGRRRVAVHSEEGPRLRLREAALAGRTDASVVEHPLVRDVGAAELSTRRLLDLAEKTGRRLHLLHVSTAEEVDLLRDRDLGDLVTAEATPHHLFFAAPGCYERHGTRVQVNPPVRELRHQESLRQAVVDGVITVVGSDHTPHTLEEKALPYPQSPSGIPGVQTTVPLLLTAVRDGWLRLQDLVRLLVVGPVRAFGIEQKGVLLPGHDGDAVVVDPQVTKPLPLDWLRSRAGFSPFVGAPLAGWPIATVVRGKVVYQDHGAADRPEAAPLSFAPAR
ncbi:MAG: dihydroorotase [Planctomycetota bacterium]